MNETTYENLKKSIDLLNVLVENLCKAVVELRERELKIDTRINEISEEINSLKKQVHTMSNEVHFR